MNMKLVFALAFFSLVPSTFAQQAPWGRADIPISSRDRVYAADQTSNTVSVIDPLKMREIRRIRLANGPGMTMFGPDGRYAFVCSSFTPELTVIDRASHQIIKRVPQSSPFCPNIAVSPENDEVWITLKDVGKVQVFRAKPPFEQIALLDTGPITNHVHFANNRNGKFAYLTIGGANEVKAYRRGAKPDLVATIPVGDLPHGIWPSGDGTRVYVAFENGEHAVV